MEEQTTQPVDVEPVAVPQAETEAPVQTTEKVDTPETEQKPTEAQAEEPAEEKQEKPKSRAQLRVEQALADKRAAEARAASLEARLKALEAVKAPNPDAYDDPTKFQADLTSHAVKQARADELKEELQETRSRADEARSAAWREKVEAVKDRFPDFVAVAHAPTLPVSETMADVISEHDNGPAILYYLGKNPEEARRIASLPPARQGLELGRIEAKVSVPPPKRTSTAPPPAPALAGGGAPATTPAPENMSMDAFAAWLLKDAS
jgi:hypothetical protein